MSIYLIRHGQTDWNIEHRFQGREDIELNETGRRQAKETGLALEKDNFSAIISSPLKRAKETAEIIAQHLGIDDVIVDEGIIERDLGLLSGLSPSEREAIKASGVDTLLEDIDGVKKRMLATIQKYAKFYAPKNIIVVSHGGSIFSVIKALHEGTSLEKVILKNTCISIVEYDGEKLSLGEYNMTGEEYRRLRSQEQR